MFHNVGGDDVVGGCAVDALSDDNRGDEDTSGFVVLIVFLGFVIAFRLPRVD